MQMLYDKAIQSHQAGRLQEAERLYRQVLAADASHPGALHLLGVIAHQTGRNEIAIRLIGAAASLRTDNPACHSNLSLALRELGRLDEAAAACRRAISLQPDYPEANYNLGVALCKQGRFAEATIACLIAVRLRPDYAEAHGNLGFALQNLDRLESSVAACDAALRVRPGYAEAHLNRGIALFRLGRSAEAAQAFRSAICLQPEIADAYSNLCIAFRAGFELDRAAAAGRRAIDVAPDYAEAHSNLGNVLRDLGQIRLAVTAFEAAIEAKPEAAEPRVNLGVTLLELSRVDDAVAAFRSAIRLKPDLADAHSNLLYALHFRGDGNAEILAAAEDFAAKLGAQPPRRGKSSGRRKRLRVGYVSGDLRQHPVGVFLDPVLSAHDRASFEIFCYSNNSVTDEVTERLKGRADHWRSLVGIADAEAAARIAGDGIDILIDLSGHTAHNRLPLFARKPAPLQISWLGYWGTTGLDAIDYVLSDATTIPEGEERFYRERVWRLPDCRFCYAPPSYAPEPAAPEVGITFGSFNNLAKVGPPVIALWAEVLRAVPQSRLLLKWRSLADQLVRDRLTEAFLAQGMEADRLVLRGPSGHAEMLAEYSDIDVALDPFPFSGGLTSCEALWMGVPVVTLPGEIAPSRQSQSFLRLLGHPEWAAATTEDYVRIAARLAADRVDRHELRQRMAASRLCDAAAFTRDFEDALRNMWQVSRRETPG